MKLKEYFKTLRMGQTRLFSPESPRVENQGQHKSLREGHFFDGISGGTLNSINGLKVFS